jgi:AraC-like DNA-binding protein
MLARTKNYHPLRLQYPFTWRWLHIFLITEAFIFSLPLAGVLLKNSQLQTVIYSWAAAGTMAIQCFYLLLHPEILYTQPFQKEKAWQQGNLEKEVALDHATKENSPQTDDTSPEKWAKNRFSEADLMHIESIIQQLMHTQRPYKKHRYSLHEFATDTRISPQKLSAFINIQYGKNLNEYLNTFRLALVTEKLQAGEQRMKTLEAIAFECGFQSRSTFIRAFKKENGITPSDFVNNLDP